MWYDTLYHINVFRTFIESPAFTRAAAALGFDDEQLRQLQVDIAAGRGRIDHVRGLSDCKKIRVRNPRQQRGARGGLRAYFVDYADLETVVLLLLTDKAEHADATPDQRKRLRSALASIRQNLRSQRDRT